MANRKWKKAMVVYQGGMSYSIGGTTFKKNRPKPVTDYELAKSLEGIFGFSVAHEYEETSAAKAEPEPERDVDFGDPPDNVEKAKKTLRSGKKKVTKKVSKKKSKTTE